MKTFDQLQEGVYDPNIFKAFFLAGGPGSGKSFVVRKTTGGLGLKVVNSDTAFEKLLKDADFDLDFRDMSPEKSLERDVIRKRAKEVTSKMQKNFVTGRLGMIIDGTGHNFGKIKKEKQQLEDMGYDCYMVFVNTSLKVAKQRNKERTRRLPEDILVKSWKDVQKNLGAFQSLFGSNFVIVDNSKFLKPEEAMKKFGRLTKKYIDKFIKKPIRNVVGKKWVKHNLALRGKK